VEAAAPRAGRAGAGATGSTRPRPPSRSTAATTSTPGGRKNRCSPGRLTGLAERTRASGPSSSRTFFMTALVSRPSNRLIYIGEFHGPDGLHGDLRRDFVVGQDRQGRPRPLGQAPEGRA